jgi:hypothetical protein
MKEEGGIVRRTPLTWGLSTAKKLSGNRETGQNG